MMMNRKISFMGIWGKVEINNHENIFRFFPSHATAGHPLAERKTGLD